jgi:hypothetical protein
MASDRSRKAAPQRAAKAAIAPQHQHANASIEFALSYYIPLRFCD